MKTEISVRQICFIMLAYTAVAKFVLYPTQLSAVAGRDLLFSAAFDFILQCAVIWGVSYLCSRTDKTFFKLIEGALGNVAARVIYGLFALFFALCTIIPLLEQKIYVHAIFYDMLPSLLVFVPVFFFTVYVAAKDFTNTGRCADVCLPLFLLSFVLVLVMSLPEVVWDNFLPVFKQPKKVFEGSLSTAYRFTEPAFLLMFMGRFKYKRGDAAKITLSYAGGALCVLLALAAFYGIYGDIAQSRQFAISKISLFFPAIEMLGRVDLLALYVLEIVMLFALALNMQLTVHCIAECTGYKNRAVLSLVVNGIFITLTVLLDNSLHAVITLFSGWMWLAVLIFSCLLPLSGWFMRKNDG